MQHQKNSYFNKSDIMHISQEKINLLRYYIKILRGAKSDCEYFRYFVKNIFPLINILFPQKTLLWREQINSFEKEYQYLEEEKITKELIEVLNRLKPAKLLKLEFISDKITFIENILNGDPETIKTIPILPPHFITAFDNLVLLCKEIFKTEKKDLLKGLVEIDYCTKFEDHFIKKHYCENCGYKVEDKLVLSPDVESTIFAKTLNAIRICPGCKCKLNFEIQHHNRNERKVPYISNYNFETPIIKWYQLRSIFDWNEIKDPFAIWFFFLLTSRCWDDLRDYFKNQKLSHEKWRIKHDKNKKWIPKSLLKARLRDSFLLGLRGFRAEMYAIQKNKQGSTYIDDNGNVRRTRKVSFFTRIRFDKYLDKIFTNISDSIQESHLFYDEPFPYAFELKITDPNPRSQLLLNVEWVNGIIETCVLHSFLGDLDDPDAPPNVIYNFITDLLKNPEKHVEINPDVSGANARKYLKKIGLTGEIDSIFVEEKTSKGATLRFNYVCLSNVKNVSPKKLLIQIKKLKRSDLAWCTKD